MCQMRVIMETAAGPEQIMEEVTGLEVTSEGIVLESFFDEPRLIVGSAVKKIDFMATLITLSPRGAEHGSVDRH
jgi:predicted RNA-binding protein